MPPRLGVRRPRRPGVTFGPSAGRPSFLRRQSGSGGPRPKPMPRAAPPFGGTVGGVFPACVSGSGHAAGAAARRSQQRVPSSTGAVRGTGELLALPLRRFRVTTTVGFEFGQRLLGDVDLVHSQVFVRARRLLPGLELIGISDELPRGSASVPSSRVDPFSSRRRSRSS